MSRKYRPPSAALKLGVAMGRKHKPCPHLEPGTGEIVFSKNRCRECWITFAKADEVLARTGRTKSDWLYEFIASRELGVRSRAER